MPHIPNFLRGFNHQDQSTPNRRPINGRAIFMSRQLIHNCAPKAIFALFILLALILAPIQALADSVTLAWDPNDETPDSYEVFKRTDSGTYNFGTPECPKQGDSPTATTCQVNNLAPNTLYHFVVRAYVGSEHSDNSDPLSYRTPATTPTTYSISASAGSHGSISPSGTVNVNSDANQLFRFNPNSGYHVDNVVVNGQSKGSMSQYTFYGVTANHTISASFSPNTYNISASAGTGGSISPAGSVSVSHGGSRTFNFSPSSGYTVADVKVDGQSKGARSSWTFSGITGNHTISVSFAPGAHTINASAGQGGSISPAGSVSVTHGGSRTFNFSPNSGYTVADVKVDGQSKGARSSWTFSGITGNHTISVSFAPGAYTINASAGKGGSISPAGSVSVTHGGKQRFNFTPASGYKIADVKVDGQSKGPRDTYAFYWITANHTISVSFTAGNQAPIAEAGPTQTVASKSKVVLNGSGSSDPDGGKLNYQWTQTNTPAVRIANPNLPTASFTAPDLADQNVTLIFELQVADDKGLTSTDTCLVQVQQTPGKDTDGDGKPDDSDTDDDDDGMPDDWELEFGLNPLVNDAGLDPDKDGQTNLEEYLAGTNPKEAPGNSPPDTPEITKPEDGSELIALSPWLMATDFLDADEDDVHYKSQWRIVDSTTQDVIWNVKTKNRRLTKIRAQRLVLDPSTTYQVMVRYFDHHGTPSEWSAPVSFTTDDDKKDANRNKIPDAQEAPIETDLNYDAIADSEQQDIIKCVTTFDGFRLMAASSENDLDEAEVEQVESFDPGMMEDSPAEEGATTYGLLAYRVKVAQPGDSAIISIYMSTPLKSPAETKWVSYDSANGWQDRTDTTEIAEDGKLARRTVRDGGPGDADGTANGTIVEMMGPLEAPAEAPDQPGPGSGLSISDGNGASSSGGDSGAGCFIGTLFN